MTCRRCRKYFPVDRSRCPYCGSLANRVFQTFQTSTVLISVDGEDMVFRSVDEAPASVRERLERSIHGSNSATFVIADRRGRRELLRTLRRGPGTSPRRHRKFTRKRLILAAVVLLMLVVAGIVFRL